MPMSTLKELYIEELEDIYDAEQQITEALPKMMNAASSPALRSSFEQHLEQTRGQIERLDQILEKLDADKNGKPCKGMRGIIAEGNEVLKEEAAPEVRDAALISAAQRVEHYEMASYGTAVTFARQLGEDQAAQLLEQTLEEEKQTDLKLTKLAESRINKKAEQAG